MADGYHFALLVEFNENGNPKLKNKLVKYFQSKKSNGGDCRVDYESPGRTAILRLRTVETRQRVLEKRTHEISLGQKMLKMTVRLPNDEETPADDAQNASCDQKTPGDGRAPEAEKQMADEEPCSTSAVLGNISQDLRSPEELLKLPVENVLKSSDCSVTSQDFSLEILPDTCSAAVTFHSGKACDQKTPGDGRAPEAENQMADEEPCSTSAVLGNISQDMRSPEEFLTLLVENVLKSSDCSVTSQGFSLEILPDTCSAVVTFHSGKENTAFITSCPSNRIFKSGGISVRPLEVTTKVRIEDIPNVSQDHILLYFENEGTDVENVLPIDEEQCAIITFKNPEAVRRVIEKKHLIEKKPVKVFPFYESLGTALYGKDRPTLKLPAAFSESIDPAICRYLHDKHEDAEKIYKDLEKHFCKVDFKQSTVCLSPLPSLLQQKGVKAKDIQEWAHAVKMAFAQALSKFNSLELQVQSTAWEESEHKIREAVLNEAVVVVPHKDKGVVLVSGLEDDVNRLEKPLREILNGIAKRVQREQSSKTEEIQLSPSIYQILFQDGLQDKILHEYPELEIAYKKESQKFTSYGLSDEVCGAIRKIMDGVLALKRRMLRVDDFVLDFLRAEDQEKLTSSLLTSKRIDAALEISGKTVQLLAVSDNALNEAEDELKNLLISQYIHVEDSNVLKMPDWQDLVTSLEATTNSSFRKVQIQTSSTVPGQQVVVSGYKDGVISICNKLDAFLHQNAKVEEVVTVKPDTIVKYIEEHKQNAWSNQVKDRVVVSFNKEAICLSGPRANVTDCKDLFERVVSSVVFNTLKVSKPGAKKFFKDAEMMYFSTVMTATGCLVQLADELDGRQDFSLGRGPKLTYQLQTPDGVEIAVCKADMCSYPVNAVVNASNEDLKHNGGLAAALLNAAGPQLQEECDKLIQQRGQLQPGDCVVTGAGGQLSCKLIIHAVGPRFDPADSQRAVGQLRKAVKGSLVLAEVHGSLSVALPAISRSLGFPLDLCADTIVKAVKDHCDNNDGDNTLKRIHLVNKDDSAVQAMEAAVRKEFGNHGISYSQQSHPTVPTQSHHGRMAQSKTNSDQALTKEGLCITLTKGNIQDATTEVVVNSVGEDLVLRSGAVSKAILGAAGPKLQDLINQKQTRGTVGDVIITNGCQLKSKKVFHTIAPHWDNGQGTAKKILSGIVKDCLSQAEGNALASMTFSAIGTGNLGFPKDLVASLMLDEVLKFSSTSQPKTLKEVVFILHPQDAQTIQAFTDEFKKRFTTSGGPAPTTTTQSKGPFSKVTSSSGMHETKMGSVVIQVVTGDITKETSDVIVNSSNESFTLKSGVSKAILDAAGPNVEVECQQLGSTPNQSMIMTQPGNLKCKKILHLVGQNDATKINKSVKDALQMCVTNSYTSVSFPALGTGQGSVQVSQVADAMLDAVVDVVSQNTQSSLKTVRIIIFQQAMLKDFHSSMQKKEGTDPQDKGGFLGNIGSRLKSFFTGGSASKPQKDQGFVILSQEVDPACFHICGDSQAKVDTAKKWISDLISKSQASKEINDSAILSLSASDRQRIIDIQATMGVRIEYKQPQALLTIEGLSKDVVNASTEIDVMLKRVRDEEHLRKDVELAGTVADWQYEAAGLQFQSFDPTSNFHLEQASKNKQPFVEVPIQGQLYKVTIPEGPATNTQGSSLKVRRIDKLDQSVSLPPHWDAMPANTPCKSFPIQPGSTEYNEVLTLFQASCKCTVLKIERIQNPSMWRSLQIKKGDMEVRNNHKNNDKRLFHGTCHTTIDVINLNGFNRSYAGKNAACYGNGTYFAVQANYSAQKTYSKPDAKGQQFMYLCRVLTGDYTLGTQGMIAPPAKSSGSNHLYDSVVNNVASPAMFIVFNDQMAYPEYLITFKS